MKIKEINKNKNHLLGGELDNMENITKEGTISRSINKKISRRTFIKAAAVAGGAVAVSGAFNFASAVDYGERSPDTLSGAGVVYKRSGCWGCAFGCGIQVRVVNGVASKIDGNPYDVVVNDFSPAGAEVDYTDIAEPVKTPGKLCPKGQAMLKELYDPYRVLTPLKRAGKRGEGKWTAISWATAIEEITNGGTLPTNTGVGTVAFDGLKQIKGAGTAMGAAHADVHADFQGNAAGNAPGAGGLGQRIIWTDGRNQQDNSAGSAQARFRDRLGASRYDHSSVCNGNWKAAWKRSIGEYIHRPDYQTGLVDYLIYIGTNPMEAEQGLNYTGRKLTDRLAAGATAIILDPRLSNTASKANTWGGSSKWIRIKQGGDGHFAMAMIKRWFDSGTALVPTSPHLKRTTTNATWLNHTNSAYLVEIPVPGVTPYGKISANVVDDDGIGTGLTVLGLTGTTNGAGMLDPTGAPGGGVGQYDSTLYSGTVYQLLKARVDAMSWASVETATGLTQAEIEGIADGFWDASYPVAMPYRGATQHSAGYYTAQAWLLVNVLRDRVDRPGGLVLQESNYGLGGAVGNAGANPTGRACNYDRSQNLPTGATEPARRAWFNATTNGVQQEIIPGEAIGYPWRIRAHIFYAHNPAYTHHAGASDVVAAMKKTDGTGYYVPLYVNLTTSMNETAELCDYVLPESTWAERWTTPQSPYGGPLVTRGTLRRPIVGSLESVTFTDTGSRSTYWYKGPFSNVTTGSYSTVASFAAAISGPQTMEDILILMGKRLRELGDANMVNFGYEGQAAGSHYDSSYDHFAAAAKGSTILGGTAGEPGTTETLKAALDAVDADTSVTAAAAAAALDFAGKPWRKFLWMGGRRQNANPAFDSGSGYNANLYDAANQNYVKNRVTGTYTRKMVWNSYNEGKRRNYVDAGYHDQLPTIANLAKTCVSVNGNDINASDVTAGYAYGITSNKLAFQTQSRTSQNEWLRELMPTNYIVMAASDATAEGLVDGDTVKLEANFDDPDTGSDASVTGEIRTSDTLIPGTIYIPHAFGRWAAGTAAFTVDGSASTNGLTTAATSDSQGNFTGGTRGANFDGEMDLSSGTAHGPVGRREPYYEGNGGGGMTDIGSGHVMYNTKVKITKV